MTKVIGIILILVAAGLAYFGVIGIIESNEASLQIGDIELGATDSSQKTTGFIFVGLAVVSLIGGVVLVRK